MYTSITPEFGQALRDVVAAHRGRAHGTTQGRRYLPVPQVRSTASGILQGTLANALVAGSTPDAYAQVNVLNPDGSSLAGGPFGALNTFIESGASGAACLLVANTQAGTSGLYPYVLLRVVPTAFTNYLPGYDGDGNFTRVPQSFYAAGASPPATTQTYVPCVDAGNDLQYDPTTTAMTVSATTATYGTQIVLQATVSHTSGDGDPTGNVVFSDSLSGLILGNAALGSGGVSATVNASPDGTAVLNAGSYAFLATYGGDSAYNTSGVAPISATSVTISQASVSVSLAALDLTSSGAITYGDNVQLTATLTPSVSGTGVAAPTGMVNFYNGNPSAGGVYLGQARGDSGAAQLSTTALPAGTLTLYAVYAGDVNFTTATGTAAASVGKAVLTVTPDYAQVTYGSGLPALTATLSGFMGGDTQSSATTGSPTVSCAAYTGPPYPGLGTYTTTAAVGTLAAANYTFSPQTGSLTVNQANLTVTADNQTMALNGTLPTCTCSTSGVVNGDTIGTPATCAADGHTGGVFPITPGAATGPNVANYSISYNTGYLTVD